MSDVSRSGTVVGMDTTVIDGESHEFQRSRLLLNLRIKKVFERNFLTL